LSPEQAEAEAIANSAKLGGQAPPSITTTTAPTPVVVGLVGGVGGGGGGGGDTTTTPTAFLVASKTTNVKNTSANIAVASIAGILISGLVVGVAIAFRKASTTTLRAGIAVEASKPTATTNLAFDAGAVPNTAQDATGPVGGAAANPTYLANHMPIPSHVRELTIGYNLIGDVEPADDSGSAVPLRMVSASDV
jgi:hypothetical protein